MRDTSPRRIRVDEFPVPVNRRTSIRIPESIRDGVEECSSVPDVALTGHRGCILARNQVSVEVLDRVVDRDPAAVVIGGGHSWVSFPSSPGKTSITPDSAVGDYAEQSTDAEAATSNDALASA
ncbi:hypothetical protein [Rhodococcus sp. HS-D2]|uniref:hypothetical protein n=1 Tax=Rhodococcus sp. HS-D2 TaxID=1384636 RepID=UPI0012E8B585|nr:hypothetical protein [Rhodococcus sp. HS-D2]